MHIIHLVSMYFIINSKRDHIFYFIRPENVVRNPLCNQSRLTLLVFEIDHSVNNILSQKPLTLKTIRGCCILRPKTHENYLI